MKWRKPLAWLLLLLLGGTGAYWWWYQWRDHSQDAPILAAAARYGMEPALVKAIVWRESRFNPGRRGRAGEIGLMQIREAAAREWATAEHVPGFVAEHLFDPGTNTLAGTWYLQKLLKRYSRTDNPLPYALADYNAGRGNVLKWEHGAAGTNNAVFIKQIGFPGTKNYVRSVTRRFEHYRAIFPGKMPVRPPDHGPSGQ
ncbi:MAG TPA: lytic transglycosylase domain-containing protein [Verrucomicrobiae bacterium]|nr:lytic transglycosylase domain-containing protein [Verrucomicrobiae bacterium]